MAITAWLVSSRRRQYPTATGRSAPTPVLQAARGGRCSVQVAFVLEHGSPMKCSCSAEADGGLQIRVRRVGLVPMPHFNVDMRSGLREGDGFVPGLVPDPLFDEVVILAAPGEVNAFWLTIEVPVDARPGTHALRVALSSEAGTTTLATEVTVAALELPPREGFPVTHWFHVDCLADRYGFRPYSEEFWPICEAYVRDLVAHGSDCLYVPMFAPPLDGVRRPKQQLLRVERSGERWRFDWSLVERWIAMGRRLGARWFEWTHLFTQWGCERAIRVYGADLATPLWPVDTLATSAIYREFLAALLPELGRFLDRHGLRERSFFHLSDEPHGEKHLANYRAAREMLRELASWMTVMEALSDLRFAREGLVDHPVAVLDQVPSFAAAGIPCWAYYCCQPRGAFLNRFFDTPLSAIALHGFLFHGTGVRGFLHWGYNYWYRSQTTMSIDPFTVGDGCAWPGWAYGDTFVVYPGERGPIASMRWEIFGEAMQDLALLRQGARAFPEVRAFDDFPRDEAWLDAARRSLLGG